ncbi:DUF1376 domain-containing protein [Ralstonia mannitolilytica]|nr:hypothetical protein CXP34_05305 [Ralstonia mannitolilytica]QIF06245.1 hypothetical protein G5A69_08470 [Ralstonia mannitolilytica]
MDAKLAAPTQSLAPISSQSAQALLAFAQLPCEQRRRFILHLNAFLYASPHGRRALIAQWDAKAVEPT